MFLGMGQLKCSDEEYSYLQRLRDRLISTKILFREAEKFAETARKAGLLEQAEREASFARGYMNLVRQIEDQIKELEARCFTS
jgi:hypothetical protein